MNRLTKAVIIPCDPLGMEMLIRSLDPWDKVLNVPCWMGFMWPTILGYGSSYNAEMLVQIGLAKWQLEERYSA